MAEMNASFCYFLQQESPILVNRSGIERSCGVSIGYFDDLNGLAVDDPGPWQFKYSAGVVGNGKRKELEQIIRRGHSCSFNSSHLCK